ncbi:MAG TPA: hypothetical protein HA362_04530 [Nanoarchaeota archaeon]|nr:hypothetical protein [Nanoarchaeota archaeon]
MADLTELGLTKNESKAFEAIIHLGKSSAAIISSDSGVPYSRIYDVLASLESKGLVKVIPEKGKKFVPGDPEALKELIEKKKKSIEELGAEVEKLKEAYEKGEKEPVELAKGKKNFYKVVHEMPYPEHTEYNVKYTAEYYPSWVRENRMMVKKGVALKTLARNSEETSGNLKKWLGVYKNIREIPNEGVAISITDDKAIMIGLIKSNVTMLIRDKPFVNLMKELFEKYYAQAKPIQKP